MNWPTPRVWLNGRRLDTSSAGSPLIVAPLEIVWGAGTGEEQPDPAIAKVTFLFRDSMADLPDLRRGAEMEITDPETLSIIIAGRVSSMNAKPSTRLLGALEVEVNIIDHMAEFNNEYVQVDWAGGANRVTQLHNEFNAAGYELRIPDDARESAAIKLNSIKLNSLLLRHISRYRGRRYDTSYRNEEDLILRRRISVYKGSTRSLRPDKLSANSTGWHRIFYIPTIDGEPSPVVVIPARNVLNDPTWSSTPEDTVTAVKMSITQPGSDGFSELADKNFRAPAAIVNEFGLRSIDIESDLNDTADWQPAAAEYFNDDAPWKMDALKIRDTELFSVDDMRVLLSPHTRYQTLAIVKDIEPNRPDPGTSDLRSYISGGEFTWTGERWEIELTLERTIQRLDGLGDWWTCERVAQSTDPLISNATCDSVGDELTVADFRFIGEP